MSSYSQAHKNTRAWPWWMSGALALLIIIVFTLLPVLAMLKEAGSIGWQTLVDSAYLRRVITFSLKQAALSTALSLLLALPMALALAHKPRFVARTLIVNLFSLSLVIPTIVAIYGIVAVFGRTGWLNELLSALSLPTISIYGLTGILIAHVFFNMPLASRILLINLEGIPAQNWRLAKQMGMSPVSVFRFIEWPAIKSQLPSLALLIFTLCFTSFAIVLTLGGGPRATTIEVAIYQALRFDFDIKLAVALGGVQLGICMLLMMLSTFSTHNHALNFSTFSVIKTSAQSKYDHQLMDSIWKGKGWNLLHVVIIALSTLYVLTPLLALLLSAINNKLLPVVTHATTIEAMINTVLVSLASATLSLGLAIGLLNSARHVRIRLKQEQAGQWLQLSGNIILVLPPLVLGTGLFLLLRPFADVFSIALVLVITINSLMALPFILRILEGPVLMSANKQDKLLQSLGIQGFNRWRLIDWPTLRKPIGLSLAIAATLSAGDLTVIALFGSERVRTLPLLLYQRMGSYRLEEAAVTAGLLLVLCLALFSILQRLVGGRKYADT
ncbi:MAG: thiamine transport system permease protein [Granulosicoccus sp.]|jgi:thiamine transport system permease protein